MLDRTSPLYHAVYTQRTACECINSHAKELGIERPRVRNGRSVANLNTLIYLVVNVRALVRAKSINQGLLRLPLLPLSDSPTRVRSLTNGSNGPRSQVSDERQGEMPFLGYRRSE